MYTSILYNIIVLVFVRLANIQLMIYSINNILFINIIAKIQTACACLLWVLY